MEESNHRAGLLQGSQPPDRCIGTVQLSLHGDPNQWEIGNITPASHITVNSNSHAIRWKLRRGCYSLNSIHGQHAQNSC
jgi:hypothetical protein